MGYHIRPSHARAVCLQHGCAIHLVLRVGVVGAGASIASLSGVQPVVAQPPAPVSSLCVTRSVSTVCVLPFISALCCLCSSSKFPTTNSQVSVSLFKARNI
jgi:hypothetical protein